MAPARLSDPELPAEKIGLLTLVVTPCGVPGVRPDPLTPFPLRAEFDSTPDGWKLVEA